MRRRRSVVVTILMMVAMACGGIDSSKSGDERPPDEETVNAAGDEFSTPRRSVAEGGGGYANDDVIIEEDRSTKDESRTPSGRTPTDVEGGDELSSEPPAICLVEDVPHEFPICVCGDLIAEKLSTCPGLVESTSPSDDRKRGIGSVGVNGDLVMLGRDSYVTGVLMVAGSVSSVNGDRLRVTESFYAGGSVTTGRLTLRDAWIGGDIDTDSLRVRNTLVQSPGKRLQSGEERIGAYYDIPVEVEAPCDCEGTVDIVSEIAQRETANDNAAIGLVADAPGPLESNQLELSGGEYHLDEIDAPDRRLTVTVTADSALYVSGDVRLASLRINREGGALELFVGGDLLLDPALRGGLTASASSADDRTNDQAHVYVAGSVVQAENIRFKGSFTAPNATVTATRSLDIDGPILIERFDSPTGMIHTSKAVVPICQEANAICPSFACD